jgi:hypothetical protein
MMRGVRAAVLLMMVKRNSDMDYRAGERGNVLWLILLGVALLAAITMVLSRGGSSTDQTGDVENLRVRASQVLRHARGIEAAIQTMKLNGVSENDISFENPTTATDYTNANCGTTDCRLFHVGGAGLTYKNFPSANGGADWIFTAANNVGTTAGPIGDTAAVRGNDIVMLLPDARASLCVQINRDLGVGTAGILPIDTSGIATDAFVGAFAGGGPSILDGDPAPFELDNQNAGCFEDANDGNKVYFYYTVLAR